MNWNFDYTIPSLIDLIFFLIFYFLKPVFLTRSNRYFFALVIFESIGFFLETLSCYVDLNASLYSTFFLATINNISLIFLLLRYALISLYFASLLQVDLKNDIPSIITTVTTISAIILILINPWTDILYNFTNDNKYSRADLYFLFYVSCFITLLLNTYYIIRFGKKFELKEIVFSIFTIIAMVSCVIFKVLLPHYLIIDLFFLFVILGLYFVFENPDIFIDKRTSLLNFSAFNRIVLEYLQRNKKVFIICFTVKNYNEKRQIYGSKQTEMALKEVGKFFLSLSHSRKCFYLRNGSFVILEKNTKDFPKLKKIVQKRFEQPWKVNNTEIHLRIVIVDMEDNIKFNSFDEISASFGIAFSDAKNKSSNQVTITKKLFEDLSRRTKVSIALNRALLEDELQVYFQPIVDSSTRKIVAAEALVRIYDNELGIIYPIEFIKMAEHNGSIEQLGEQVLNKVCIYLKKTNIYKYGVKWINVNLSPIQCQNKKLPEKIDNITRLNTIDHKYIHLEITEDSMIDADILKTQMDLLITDGYNFSLDDFGSGFSNVTRVKLFPFNNVKLDMNIVKEHFKNPDEILPSVVKSFTKIGLSVTAEGVETAEMATMLENMGCKYLQGYYFSKPIPAEDFENILKEQK